MYFISGWPKVFCATAAGADGNAGAAALAAASVSPDGRYLATLAPRALTIWTAGQHRVQVGTLALTDDMRGKAGEYRQMVWRQSRDLRAPASSYTIAIAALPVAPLPPGPDDPPEPRPEPRPGVFVHVHTLTVSPVEAFENEGEGKVIPLPPPVDVSSPPLLLYNSSGAFHSMMNCHDLLAVGAGETLSFYSWDGQFLDELSVAPPPPAKGSTASDNIVFGTFCNRLSVFGFVRVSGKAFLMILPNKQFAFPLAGLLDIRPLHTSDAVCLAIAGPTMLVAVGRKNGEVDLCQLMHTDLQYQGKIMARTVTPTRTLSLSPWGISPADTGAVSCMCWSPVDAHVLAVAWASRGFSVWSRHGCRLVCTIPTGLADHDGTATHAAEIVPYGVSAMSWDASRYFLYACPARSGTFVQLSFLRSALNSTPFMHLTDRFMLHGDDRLLLLNTQGDSPADFGWITVPIRRDYITSNWPLRMVCVSRDGNLIAAAGTQGVAVYDTQDAPDQAWHVFGDVREEQEIVCTSMCWFNQVLVLATPNADGTHMIRMYPGTTLSNQVLLHPHKQHTHPPPVLARAPLYMDCSYSSVCPTLVLYTADHHLYQYQLITQMEGNVLRSVDLSKVFQMSLACVQPSVSIALPCAPLCEKPAPGCRVLFLQPNGQLFYVDTRTGKRVHVANNVEQFWQTRCEGLPHLGPLLWVYGRDGLQLVLPKECDNDGVTPRLVNAQDGLDSEVYPVGVVPRLGVLVGVSQHVATAPPLPLPHFELNCKVHPFVHVVLQTLLYGGDVAKARNVAWYFSLTPHFEHSLELLLYSSLHEDRDTPADAGTPAAADLKLVVDFLRGFPIFAEVLTRCARKIDVVHWQRLFDVAGSPEVLFQECLSSQRLLTASSFLRVILQLEGEERSTACALQLLPAVLEQDDMGGGIPRSALLPPEEDDVELRADLMRFISPAPSNTTPETETQLESVLTAHAVKLIQHKFMKKLLAFGHAVNRPLASWFARERAETGGDFKTASDFAYAVDVLHKDFGLPNPETILPPHCLATTQLNELLREAQAAMCSSWVLVFATVLLTVDSLTLTLHEHCAPSEQREFMRMLSESQAQGYQQLHELLTAQEQRSS
eukprot:TRINITY_DN562_c0_g1_i1.p1 TRINITY_DN562_c0_g1~~TRINITY_DN562_c0_g1_i1.p1  ORF type:complete len:1111 (-),score=235.94 TRINITY_DN562_c0_g1_i1:2638-5970(-)